TILLDGSRQNICRLRNAEQRKVYRRVLSRPTRTSLWERPGFSNVDIFASKDKIGEIDVLVIYGNRAIVVQAKSKRLTLEARKGNDRQIKDDFKKSVQDSYNQGLICSKSLGVPRYKLVDGNSKIITVPKTLKEIYIFCVVSDHYPALSFQTRQFLKYETTDSIQPPLVLDVFTLDAMTEMLPSPLHFLSYVNRRANYSEKILTSHELTILSYHLKNNLWLDDKYDIVQLGDDISADLDVAMAVRRDGVKGKRNPSGILTRFTSTTLGRIVKKIEADPDPGTIDFGFLLLTLSEDTVVDVSRGIDKLTQLALQDRKNHDITIGLDTASTGLTIHINDDPVTVAGPLLQKHCERRKYSQKASSWFGACISPTSHSLRFGIYLSYEWQQSAQMDFITRDMPRSGDFTQSLATMERKHKVGRNDPCPCKSGKKLKKCCLGKKAIHQV
ncbi:MAG: SEC-C metal-binding domain-containing protein, partial [Desulfuromonadaceae bacterium]|nr:SEC-C metal-binding domain-containing protein [Desulfuromonadaceae bacterium]